MQHPHGRPQRRAPHGKASRILIPRHHGASRTALNKHRSAACPSATLPPAPQDRNQPHIIRSHEKGKPFSLTCCQQLLGYGRPAARTTPARKPARTATATDLAGPLYFPRVSHLDDNPQMHRLKSVLEDDSRA